MTTPEDQPITEAPEQKRPLFRRIVRAVFLGVLTGLALVVGLVFYVSGRADPVVEAADVCRDVPGRSLNESTAGVPLFTVCQDIDVNLELPLGGVAGFEGVLKAPEPPSDPTTQRPAYLVWASDGCSAPVLGAGPFDFTLSCNRHDFGWRNLRTIDGAAVPVWHVSNKDRVDAGFLHDMRDHCAPLSTLWRIGCDTTARVYYTAVRLNPAGVDGLPGRQ